MFAAETFDPRLMRTPLSAASRGPWAAHRRSQRLPLIQDVITSKIAPTGRGDRRLLPLL
jgi:hypothetical protein